jgi:glycosyltransferase involved in cell wall biosynthesis
MTTLSGPVLLVADAASVHTRRLAVALRDSGLSVVVAGFEGEALPGVRLIRLGTQPVARDARYLMAVPVLARWIRRLRPAVVHGHYVSSYGVLASLAWGLARWRAPLVQTAWGTDLLITSRRSRRRARLASIALRPAAVITGDSDDLLQEAARLAPRVRRTKFVFGPPRDLFEVDTIREPLVLSSRRLDPDMRVDLVVRAFRRARELSPDLAPWRLAVAGTGESRAEVAAAADADPAVDLLGQLDATELSQLLARACVVVSVPSTDATSAALLEARDRGDLGSRPG